MLPYENDETRKRVLIIDDDPMVRESLEMLFDHYGWDVLAVESGDLVLEALRPIEYNLAVVDHLMDGVSGVDLIRELKSRSRAPVFMLTGCVDPTVRHTAEMVGADRFFSKPVQAKEMIRALNDVAPDE